MKNNILILLFFISFFGFSQNVTNAAYYEITNADVVQLKAGFGKVIKTDPKDYFVLYFNENESLFVEESVLKGVGEAYIVSSNKVGKLYKNNEQYINRIEFMGKYFLIKENLPHLKWTVDYRKTKKIMGYNCVYATSSFLVKNDEGETVINIECFFTEAIKTNQGPNLLHGLNGLILEGKIGVDKFICTEVKKVKESKIKIPTKGEKVNKKQFNKIVEEYILNKQNKF